MEKKFASVAMNENNPNWEMAIKREKDLYGRPDDIRSPFGRDYTRVLHSLAYRRLKHKTQVFFNAAGNDHICTRIEHVGHVESVSNTIAKALGLNEELTKAIALAHDLGHAPFGHQGEHILTKLTEKYLGKSFWHEQNGVYFVDKMELLEDYEKNYQNLNLTYAVRDGIISHCGEVDQNEIRPRTDFFSLEHFESAGQYQAATWEGCIVKLADKIAYLGRDIEDAERLGFFNQEQQNMLRDMAKVNNQKAINTTVIMHNMIIDLCENSSVEKGLCLSPTMAQQLNDIKKFNYTYIYDNKRLNASTKYSQLILTELFEALLGYYDGDRTIENLFRNHFDNRQFIKDFADSLTQYCDPGILPGELKESIVSRYQNEKIYGMLDNEKLYIQAIIDFIAGMTDAYAVSAFHELLEC